MRSRRRYAADRIQGVGRRSRHPLWAAGGVEDVGGAEDV
jgi:hypothetical protein